MRWFISVSLVAFLSATIFGVPTAYACPLCFASSGPNVLHAYLVSAFFMIVLAWTMIGIVALYAFHLCSNQSEQRGPSPYLGKRAVDTEPTRHPNEMS